MSDVFGKLVDQARELLRSEVRLARHEASRKLVQAGKGMAMLAGALVMGLAVSVMSLVTLMTIFAAIGLPVWLSALFATLVGLAAAGGLAWAGLGRLSADGLLPERTLRQLRRDKAALKEQIR